MMALGLNGAPGIVTAAVIVIDLTEFNFSAPPIDSMCLSKIPLTVISSLISFLNTGLSIEFPYLS